MDRKPSWRDKKAQKEAALRMGLPPPGRVPKIPP
jgi:hypothetical protein